MGKYPETVNYTLGKTVTNFDVLDGTKYEGDDDENNAWTRYLKEKLNVQNTNLFEANDGDDYEQKVSMAIVSGEIPDIMGVGDYDTLKQLYENDLIADLTEVYENCASDKIKEIYDSYDGVCLKTAMFDGKLMGLPTTEISHGPGILWLRKDWMDKCGLEEPKTMEDIYNILEQFLVQDPGGNGEGKTVGLVIDPEIAGDSGGSYMANNIFTLYGAFPKQWILQEDGTVVYGSVQPQIKEALAGVRKLYEEKLLDDSFMLRTMTNIAELIIDGKCGSFFGPWWAPNNPLMEAMEKNPDAVWEPYLIRTTEDGKRSIMIRIRATNMLWCEKTLSIRRSYLKMAKCNVRQKCAQKDKITKSLRIISRPTWILQRGRSPSILITAMRCIAAMRISMLH